MSDKKVTKTVDQPFMLDGKQYKKGDKVELTADQAKRLCNSGENYFSDDKKKEVGVEKK